MVVKNGDESHGIESVTKNHQLNKQKQCFPATLPSGTLTWQWKIPMLCRKYIFIHGPFSSHMVPIYTPFMVPNIWKLLTYGYIRGPHS